MDSSKKRPNDTSMEEDSGSKKFNSSGDATLHLKVLVPSGAAGGVIGKGGETIAEIQKNVGARIKMSKANDFYPGSNERVCLITGNAEAIAAIVSFIGEKIRDGHHHRDGGRGDYDSKVSSEREKQMKVIVPNSTAGMIIGKGGAYVKQIKERSGSFIQLSQKSKETTLPERVITIIGDEENNKEALDMILAKVAEDPQSGSCLNISYNEFQGPVANINPTGSPFANGGGSGGGGGGGPPQVPPMLPIGMCGGGGGGVESGYGGGVDPRDPGGYNLPLVGGGAVNMRLNFNPNIMTNDPRMMTQYLGHVNNSFRAKGYSDKAAEEITRALNVLTMHGVLQVEMITGSMGPPPAAMMMGGMGGGGHMEVDPAYGGGGYQRGRGGRTASPSSSSTASYNMPPVNNNSFGLAMAGHGMPSGGADEAGSKVEIEVHESLVGAVIGPAGKSIVEMQHYTGAIIQISKKGVYAPGTKNRIVTITGPAKSLKSAQYLVDQRVAEEEAKRVQMQQHQNKGY